ncbi:MAG TPA: GNAT family N-acetyltransferase [Cyclobacteriaceae bacterium]|nr:GNAT family N-acetyltransferase [Cyclobacteriaceae bacterium]
MNLSTKKIDPLNVTFQPSKVKIREIERWLIKEEQDTGEGFYCNWKIITSAFKNESIATISENDRAVGFVCWHESGLKATIDIAEIKPAMRGRGLGKILINQLLGCLKLRNIVVVDLQCAPPSSEPVWRQLGFETFPERTRSYNSSGSNVELYKSLVPSLATSTSGPKHKSEIIELWDGEPYQAIKNDPSWKWEIIFKPGTRGLVKPIIYPGCSDWRIRWSKNHKTYIDDKVKYFINENIYQYGFIIITTLPKPKL